MGAADVVDSLLQKRIIWCGNAEPLPTIGNRTIALVTGTSSGIGEAVARKLLACGMIVVGCARRDYKLKALAESLPNDDERQRFYGYKCDLLDESQLRGMFNWLGTTFNGQLNLLVNNAGTARFCSMLDAPLDALELNFALNCKAQIRCAHYALQIMLKQHQNDNSVVNTGGQLIFVNSIAAHLPNGAPLDKPFLNGYCASKHALRVMVSGLRTELRNINNGDTIRIGEISPGFVETEIFDKAFPPHMRAENAQVRQMINEKVLKQIDALQPSDVAELVKMMALAPPHVDINEIIVRPTKQIE